ncbi:MAG: hypothetical protein ACFFD4_07015 [Candidatus Odinarchaeota archaeon]
MVIISLELDSDLEKKLQFLLEKLEIDSKSVYIYQLVERSIKEDILWYLCKEVKIRRMTAWKAAEIAGITLRDMLKELAYRGVILYDKSALID